MPPAGEAPAAPAKVVSQAAHSTPLDTKRWSRERIWNWYQNQAWPCGFNYIPANTISYTEMWMPYNFDPQQIEKELAMAKADGFNCARVVLPFVVWEHDPAAFKNRLSEFLAICERNGIKVMFAMFDDCAFGHTTDPIYGPQPVVVPGWYANGWTPSPGHKIVRDQAQWPRLEKYVKDVIGSYKNDNRVWIWDLYNEPTNFGLGDTTVPLVNNVFTWAREINPTAAADLRCVRHAFDGSVWRSTAAMFCHFTITIPRRIWKPISSSWNWRAAQLSAPNGSIARRNRRRRTV